MTIYLFGFALQRSFEVPEPRSLFELFSTDVRRVLDWPLFNIGAVPVTLLFLIKCVLFLIALSLFTRIARSLQNLGFHSCSSPFPLCVSRALFEALGLERVRLRMDAE